MCIRDSFQWKRSTEQIALTGMASGNGKEFALLLRFHSLGDYRKPQALCQRDDGASNGRVIGVTQYVTYERLINL